MLGFIIYLPPSHAQSAASLSLDTEVVKAGTSFTMTVTFDRAPSYDGNLVFVFSQNGTPLTIGGSAPASAGKLTTRAVVSVGADVAGGVYTLSYVNFNAGQVHPLQVKPVQITVTPSDVVTPTSTVVALTPSQEQFLNTRAKKLESILDELSSDLERNGNDELNVRLQAAALLKEAQKQLAESGKGYKMVAGHNLRENPIFFDDFDRHYSAAILDLTSGHISRSSTLDTHLMPQPKYHSVAFQSHSKQGSKSLTGSLASVLDVSVSLVKDNVAAYQKIVQTGSDRFKMTIRSTPPGATISYKRVGFDYSDLSKTTDLIDEEFDFALWTFRIQKGTCAVYRHPNPYLESNLDFEIPLNCGRK